VRSVVVASPDESIAVAARRMRDEHVGTLVVLDADQRPVGILTDRDVVLRCVAEGRDPAQTLVGDAMSRPVAHVSESTSIEDALARMATSAARRIVVTDDAGRLAGILALDDVLDLLAEEGEAIRRLLERRRQLG
jgi:CBS domain-containing protein